MADLLTRLYAMNERTQGLIAHAVAIIFLILAGGLIYLTYDHVRGTFEDMQNDRVHLGEILLLSKQVTKLEKAAHAADVDDGDIYLSERNADIASASLQNWLNERALQNGAQVQSVETASRTDGQKRASIILTATITGTYPALNALIAEIENHRPVLFIGEAGLATSDTGETEGDQLVLKIAFGGYLYPKGAGRAS